MKCISLLACCSLEWLQPWFSRVCLTHFCDSLASFFSVAHFLLCPREAPLLPHTWFFFRFVCLCHIWVLSGHFCPAYLSFALFVNWLSLSPLVRLTFYLFLILLFQLYLGSLFPHVLSASLGPFSLSPCSVCLHVSVFFLSSISSVLSLSSAFFLLLTFRSFGLFMCLCLPLLDVLQSSFLAYFLCMCAFAYVCIFVVFAGSCAHSNRCSVSYQNKHRRAVPVSGCPVRWAHLAKGPKVHPEGKAET